MFQWWKNQRLKKQNRLQNKLKQEIKDLEEALDKQITLYEIKTKQYNDFMVEAEVRVRKYKSLLEKEKSTNGRLLDARTKEIGNLKQTIEQLQTENKKLIDNNNTLRTTLGHF